MPLDVELREALEAPGPEIPGEGEPKPPEDDFDPREYLLFGDIKGEERLKWLEKYMNERRDHDYYTIPYTSKGNYSDFTDQANFEYFDTHYSFLNYTSEAIGFHRYAVENPDLPEDKQDFESYLSNIEDDEWDQFTEEVKAVRNGECMDDDRASNLEMEATTEFFNDNYDDFIDALRHQKWIHSPEYSWLLNAVGKFDAEDVYRICRDYDLYPENEGDGSVHMNLEKAAETVEPDVLIKFLEGKQVSPEVYTAEWANIRNKVWNEQASTGYLFDQEMREQLAEHPELARSYNMMDAREARVLFDRCLADAAENPKENNFPRWALFKPGYYDRNKEERWVVMYPLDAGAWARLSSDEKQEHIVGSMYEFVRDYVLPALANRIHRVPKEHPELPFKDAIPRSPAPPAQEALEPAPAEAPAEDDFDPREYLTAEPSTITDFLAQQGFKLVANGTWQHEDDRRMVMVLQDGNAFADVWRVSVYWADGKEDIAALAGKSGDRADDAKNEKFVMREIKALLNGRKGYQPVQEAEQEPPLPAPPGSDPDEFDPRAYFAEPVDTGKLVKETATMWVITPTEDTIERFIAANQQRAGNPRVIGVNPLYMVIPKSGEKRFLIGIWTDGTLYTPPFPVGFADRMLHEMDFSKDLRRFLRSHAVQYLRDNEEHLAMRMLAHLYGSKAVLKYIDKYDFSDDLKLKLGIDAAKRGDSKTAAKLLKHPPQLLAPEGCTWLLKDWTDLSQFFADRHQSSAESVLGGDVDASWVYDNAPDVKDVLEKLEPSDYALIREVLPHRIIQPYEDKGPVMLTTPLLKEFSDDDIEYWLGAGAKEVDPEDELDDIRQALTSAACDAWESVAQNDWFEGYKYAALDAVDAEAEWKGDKLHLSINWEHIEGWLAETEDNVSDIDELLYNYAPKAEPSEDYSHSGWDDADNLGDFIDARLSELEPPDFPYDPKQLTLPGVMGPNPNEYVPVTSYNKHSPHGYETKMKRKDMERWQREEPWRLDPEKWAAYAREHNIEIPARPAAPPVPGVGESLASALLEQAYSYAVTMLEVPAPQSDFIFEWGRLNVPDERLYFGDPNTNPRETEQHVTVKYGLTVDQVPDELRQITEAFKPFPVYIGKVSLFRNPEFDVVKLDVESPWLRKLNAEISAFPNEDKHPEYHPHLTIAYVKKGSCDDLEGVDIFENGQASGVNPQFIAYGLVFKGSGDDQGNRSHETLLFSRTKKTQAVESEPFNGVPFPLDPEHVSQFLKTTRTRARRTIL